MNWIISDQTQARLVTIGDLKELQLKLCLCNDYSVIYASDII